MKSKPLLINKERHPTVCQWEITCRCNLKCVMCYTDCFNTPEKISQELSTAQIINLMDQMIEEGLLDLTLTGGEPFSRPDFFDIYEHAVKNGLRVTLFSNGTLIHESVANRLAEFPPVAVEISLHGAREEVFESVTDQGGSYSRCIRGIELLRSKGIPVVIKVNAMTLNQGDLVSVKRLAEEWKCGFRLGEAMRLDLEGRDFAKKYDVQTDELYALLSDESVILEEMDARKKCHSPEEGCKKGNYAFHIDAYGKMQLCSNNRRDSYDLISGSFKEGFYSFMPQFRCAFKKISQTNRAPQTVRV